jgi:hypothetical protein
MSPLVGWEGRVSGGRQRGAFELEVSTLQVLVAKNQPGLLKSLPAPLQAIDGI